MESDLSLAVRTDWLKGKYLFLEEVYINLHFCKNASLISWLLFSSGFTAVIKKTFARRGEIFTHTDFHEEKKVALERGKSVLPAFRAVFLVERFPSQQWTECFVFYGSFFFATLVFLHTLSVFVSFFPLFILQLHVLLSENK